MWKILVVFLRANWQVLLLGLALAIIAYNLWSLYSGRQKAEAQVQELKEQVLNQQAEAKILGAKVEEQNRSLEELGNRLSNLRQAVDQAQRQATAVRRQVQKTLDENRQAPTEAQPALDWAVTRGHQLNKVWEGQ